MTPTPKWSDLVSLDRSRAIAAANQLLPAWVSLVIVVLIGWQLAGIIWSLMPGSSAGANISVPAGQLAVGAGGTATDVQAIANVHLFGEADRDDAPIAGPGPEIEANRDTNINLTLRGTHASNDPNLAVAMISIANEQAELFAIGDMVAAGATIHAVYPERVLLNERGELTNLRLPRDYTGAPAPRPQRTTTSTTRQTAGVQSIQQVVAQNVSRLADVIRPTPYFVNGQQQGYRVYPGRDREQFAAFGLRPGDLVSEIDGQSLSDQAQAMQIFQRLGTAEQVSLTVMRDGSPTTIVLRTDQLDLGKDQTQ